MMQPTDAPKKRFCLEEATIDELHQAIKAGEITCLEVVQRYIERVRAYNGVCSMLVTEDGAPVPQAAGPIRAQEPVVFPTATVKASADCLTSTSTKDRPLNSDAWSRLRPTLPCSNSSE